jgi:hypothetical protein
MTQLALNIAPNYRFYRGCKTFLEAQSLGEGYQHKKMTYWTDSLNNAAMYGDYVICIELDELPPHFNKRKGIAEGDDKHGNIREWRIPRDYYEKDGGVYCCTEEAKILVKGHDF